MNIPKHMRDLPISHWQIAINGMWETARQIDVETEGLDEILKWVASAPQDIAIEAFFGDKQETFFFFGIRIEALTTEEKQNFIRSLFKSINKKDTLDKIIKTANVSIAQGPELMELGAEGFWKSYGSYIVWEKGDKEPANIEKIGNNAPQILKEFKRPMMLEFAWSLPHPMWVGIPVSDKIGKNKYKFSEEQYTYLIKEIATPANINT